VIETDDGAELTVSYEEAETLRLAYAISVHKSQGCEVPVVVFVCHPSHSHMLTRPLVYTAITRARQHCVIVGTRAALATAVKRDDSGRRFSSLAERLRVAAA
jgi:exodeoxyribonuclease V alpha subunit